MARITRVIGGETYSGDYTVEKGMVVLVSDFGVKRTQIGSMTAEHLAGIMLSEQVSTHLMSTRQS